MRKVMFLLETHEGYWYQFESLVPTKSEPKNALNHFPPTGFRHVHEANRILLIDEDHNIWLLKDRWDCGGVPRCLSVKS